MPVATFTLELPNPLPGRFFVVTRSRLTDEYTLFIDDADRSSYKLGVDAQSIVQRFRTHGIMELMLGALDMAREFGAAQVVMSDRRIIPIKLSNAKPQLTFDDGEEQPNAFLQL